jgi:hypothetical protein
MSFVMGRSWTPQNFDGTGGTYVIGTGTAVCNPCIVAGRTGSVTFALSVLGLGEVSVGPILADLAGGAWTITSATGGLTGLTGQGTYGQQLTRPNGPTPIVFTGTYVLPT